MDIYMKTLDGYIKDENKLVTYKWLSNELELHVNFSKLILDKYWNKHKNDIVATMVIIGYLKSGEMRVELVEESNLKNATKKYEKVISQHIYSLQKTLLDIQLLVDVGTCDTKYTAICCEKNTLIIDEELFARRWGTDVILNTQHKLKKLSVDKIVDAKNFFGVEKFLKKSGENETFSMANAKVEQERSEQKKISPPKNLMSPKKGAKLKKPIRSQKTGFGHLFGKISATNEKKNPPINITKKNKLIEMENELINENVDNTNNSVKKLAIEHAIESSIDEKSSDSLRMNKISTVVNKKSIIVEKPESQQNEDGEINRGSKRERSEESKGDLKKRKRIVMVSDSSEESATSDNEICDSPPQEEIIQKEKSPSPTPVQNISGKRKIRKLVNKTYMDEDDKYLITKKENVYESCSEEDESTTILEPKKIIEPSIKVVKKQTTLMNFFKKA